jgi:hypothetical protein
MCIDSGVDFKVIGPHDLLTKVNSSLGNYEPQIFVNTLQYYFKNFTQMSFCEQAIVYIFGRRKIIFPFLCGPPIGY